MIGISGYLHILVLEEYTQHALHKSMFHRIYWMIYQTTRTTLHSFIHVGMHFGHLALE